MCVFVYVCVCVCAENIEENTFWKQQWELFYVRDLYRSLIETENKSKRTQRKDWNTVQQQFNWKVGESQFVWEGQSSSSSTWI